ncbi:hypothetical protein BH24ACT6_BH24ACT6_19590 [soil metagenome]
MHTETVWCGVATHQIAVRLPSELLAELDRLVATGSSETRAAAVRAGIAAIVAGERRRTIDEQIVAGYLRQPSTMAESEVAIASLREAIVEERW